MHTNYHFACQLSTDPTKPGDLKESFDVGAFDDKKFVSNLFFSYKLIVKQWLFSCSVLSTFGNSPQNPFFLSKKPQKDDNHQENVK